MDEKTKSENDKPTLSSLSKANKILILVIAIIFSIVSAFNIYLEFRITTHRQIMCSQMILFNAQIPPSDINSYILREKAFENVCLERTGLGSYFWALVSFGFLGYAINLFRNSKQLNKPILLNQKRFMNRLWNENKIAFIIIIGGIFIAGYLIFFSSTIPSSFKNQIVPDDFVQPTVSGEAQGNCIIKGNIGFNTREKIYHLPNCPYYLSTKIDERYGERWFCTEEEAVSAGWRKAYNCP